MQYYLAIWSLALGLVFGSFLNVVIYRVPRRESLVRPGSHCPTCGTAIRWFDNIPVAGWLLLRGHCRSCRCAISVRYPVVEALTGASFLGAYLVLGPVPRVLLAWAFIAVVIAVAFINYDTSVVPGRLAYPAAAIGLVASASIDQGHWWQYVAGCLGAALVTLLVAAVVPGVTRFGEAKISLILGSVLGPYTLVALPLWALIAIFMQITLLFSEKYRLRGRTAVPGLIFDGEGRAKVEVERTSNVKADAEVMTWL